VTPTTRLALTGVGCVGSAYGMARYGFGLLLPDMRAALGLSTAVVGAIAAAGYGAYLAGSLAAGGLVRRHGPRAVVLWGGGCAVAGMLLAAAAPSALVLMVAVAIAGTSAALVFPPFADALASVVPEGGRARAFASISSGTGAGVAVAAPLSLLSGDWRLSWVLFAVVAAFTTLLAARVVPAAPHSPDGGHAAPAAGRPRGTRPLLASAALVGLGAAVFWTWAVDRIASIGGLGAGAAQALLAVVGVASLGGALAGDLVARAGVRAAAAGCGAVLAAALVSLALAPGALAAGIAAAVLFGAGYNVLVATQGLWSSRVFVDDPARGLALAMSAMGVGFLAGPLLAAPLDQRTAFLAAAVLLLAGGVLGLAAPSRAKPRVRGFGPAARGARPVPAPRRLR
jgi:predicted MFS family arabinose efflux permease